MGDPRTIDVVEQRVGEVGPTSGRFRVSIAGERLLTGAAVLQEAAGVRGLIDELSARGIGEEAVSLTSIHAVVGEGMLDGTDAGYTLTIRLDDLSLVGALLDVVVNQDSCSLTGLAWDYEDHEVPEAWLESCLAAARKKANVIAKALGVKIDKLHSVSSEVLGGPSLGDDIQPVSDAVKKKAGSDGGSTVLTPARQMGVSVWAAFEID